MAMVDSWSDPDFNRLLAYLLELDGRDADGPVIDRDLLFRDRFESGEKL